MTEVVLGDVARFVRGVTFKPTDVVADGGIETVGVMRTKNVQAVLDQTDVIRIPSAMVKRQDQLLLAGDTLISSANSWNLVGKCCWVPELDQRAAVGGFVTALRPASAAVDARYLYHWFSSPRTQALVRSFGNQTTNIANLNLRRCEQMRLLLPSLDEQRRIAAILDQADALRAKRHHSLESLNILPSAIFREMFAEHVWEVGTVGDAAEVQGGLQVTAKRKSLPLESRYLRVANVYRNRLDLTEVKTIRVTSAELQRARLVYGDVLVVEGHGNPKEVGRAAMWAGAIDECVHQNHLIRIRFDHSKILPEFGLAWLNSPDGRRHLLRAAKTTSGLNTISTANVKAAPIPLLPVNEQERFADRVSEVQGFASSLARSAQELDQLFLSLQSRLFESAA